MGSHLNDSSMTLPVSELFLSIQGEGSYIGRPCTFIRLAGCNLRCKWCDTQFSWEKDSESSPEETVPNILMAVHRHNCRIVELTGGEPLLHGEKSYSLMDALSQRGYTVLLETNGSLDIGAVPNSVHIVMDVKCPSSGMHDRMYFENFNLLKSIDDVKFVIADRTDFDYAVDVILTHGVHRKANCILSPGSPTCDPRDLAAWLLEKTAKLGPSVFMQLQLHKYIWDPNERER